MTTERFMAALTALPIVFAGGLWLYAYSLAGPMGRNRLLLGLPHLFHRGRHVIEHGSEEERERDFADMRAEARTAVLPAVAEAHSSALVGFTHEIRMAPLSPELERDGAGELPTDAKLAFQAAVDVAVEEFRRTLDDMIDLYLSGQRELVAV